MSKIAIVAAMEREVQPLVKGWTFREQEHDGRRFRFFEKDAAVLVCGGIGAEAARRAAEATIELYSPDVIYSAGFAGALDPKLKVGEILLPRRLVNAGDGSSFEMEVGGGVLVSFGAVAGKEQKKKLRDSFSADAVDMEAAVVARAAQLRGVRFGVVKAISDEFDFDLPESDRFVDANGRFSEARFALFSVVRPWLWPRVVRLAVNSGRAAGVLSEWLEKNMDGMAGTADGAQTRPLETVNRP
jgi:adenosylhomocysteine nucleosidase